MRPGCTRPAIDSALASGVTRVRQAGRLFRIAPALAALAAGDKGSDGLSGGAGAAKRHLCGGVPVLRARRPRGLRLATHGWRQFGGVRTLMSTRYYDHSLTTLRGHPLCTGTLAHHGTRIHQTSTHSHSAMAAVDEETLAKMGMSTAAPGAGAGAGAGGGAPDESAEAKRAAQEEALHNALRSILEPAAKERRESLLPLVVIVVVVLLWPRLLWARPAGASQAMPSTLQCLYTVTHTVTHLRTHTHTHA